MAQVLAANWWALALRGLCGVLFGILAFILPGAAIAAIVLVFGAYALLEGVFSVVAAIRARHEYPRWGSLLALGVVGILAGIWAFVAPAMTALALVMLVAAWAVITGMLEIAAAIRLRKSIRGEWLLALGGLVSIVFGVALWLAPIAGAVVLAWWIGAYMLIAGAVQIGLALRLRRWGREGIAGAHPEKIAA